MAANRFHINQDKGEIGACRAEQGRCPFGSTDEHYDSMVDAAQAYEKSMESQVFSTVQKPRKIYGADLGLTPLPGVASGKETLSEITESLAQSVSAPRPYGFPEDEQTRYYMDKSEKSLLQSASEISGVEPREIRARVLDRTPVSRTYGGLGDTELENRHAHLTGLKRLTEAKLREIGQLNRELAIRKIQDASPGVDAHEVAAEHVKNRTLTASEVAGIIGAPREDTLSELSPRAQYIWESELS